METWIIIVLAVAGALLLALIIGITIFCCRRQSNDRVRQPLLTDFLNQKVPVQSPVVPKHVEDQLILTVRMYLRSTTTQVEKPLLHIGGRPGKFFFKVTGNALLSAVTKGPRSKLGDHPSIKKAFRSLMQRLGSTHPLLSPPHEVDFLNDSGLCIAWRNICSKGSLRDLIHDAKWQDNADYKYRKAGKPLKEEKIARYGRQMLFALLWLESCGLPYTHLHAGNVLIDKDVCFLSDLELPFLCVPRHYEKVFQEFALKFPRAAAIADLNVLSFGATLFELAVGRDMTSLVELDYYPQWASVPVKELLQKILRPSGETAVVPTLAELFNDPFFASASDVIKVQPPPVALDDIEKELVKHALRVNSKALDDPRNKDAPRKSVKSGLKASKYPSLSASASSSLSAAASSSSSSSSTVSAPPARSPSSSSVAAAKPAAPAAPARPASSAPSPPPPPPADSRPASDTFALLHSIEAFSTAKLKKTVTNDRSAPQI